MKLIDLLEHIKKKTCKWCEYEGLDLEEPQMYAHPGGYELDGEDNRQWVYIECPHCGYAWALWKLGVPHPSSFLKGDSE